MVLVVSFSVYIGTEVKSQNRQKTGKRRLYVQLNIEQSYYKLTLKASDLILLANDIHHQMFCHTLS